MACLALIWAVIAWQFCDDWKLPEGVKAKVPKHRDFHRWESLKGAVVTLVLVGLFVLTDWPRDLIALTAAAILLANAHFSSHKMLHRVDWQLLILFIGLFVVNGALLMVEFANRQRSERSAFEAMLEAGKQRFRPILLTTLTTFGGLMPIIFETSNQARHLIPMAISLGYGIVFATAINLLLVPSLYVIFDDLLRATRLRPGELQRASGAV